MHRRGVGVGRALAALRANEKFSDEAIDRRVAAAATATSLTELGFHLRSLVTQLKGIDQPVDYTQLMDDLVRWQDAGRRARVRRRWGSDYFLGRPADADVAAAVDPGVAVDPEPTSKG
jgi:CRISPR system Cascade subunit CasB